MVDYKVDLCKYRWSRSAEELQYSLITLEKRSYSKSVNCIYYAFFHAMRAMFALDGIDYTKHEKCIGEFNKLYVNKGLFDKRYGRLCNNLFVLRDKTDYDDFYITSKAEAKQ